MASRFCSSLPQFPRRVSRRRDSCRRVQNHGGGWAGAEAGKVGGFDLAVDQGEVPLLGVRCDEGDEGCLGGVRQRENIDSPKKARPRETP